MNLEEAFDGPLVVLLQNMNWKLSWKSTNNSTGVAS